MRKNNVIRTLGTTLFLAPLLVGCGADGAGGGGGMGTGEIPTCSPGQALSTNDAGQIICKSLPSGAVVLPTCDQTTEALTSTTAGVACTQKAAGSQDASIVQRVNNAELKINDYGTQIGMLETRPAAKKLYVGNTMGTTNGQINPDGTDNSLTGAAKVCSAQYGAGARMCTVQDIYHSVLAGKITSANSLAEAWVWAAAMTSNGAGNAAAERLHGLTDNCGSYTYPTGDKAWYGVTMSTGMLSTSRWGVRFKNGTDAGCATARPIACCK